MKQYAKENHIFPTARLFPITERAVQKNLDIVSSYLGWKDISSHSFRKYYATQIYINNGYDIELVRILLQHSSIEVTRKYIGIQTKRIEDAINGHLCIA
jgi:site-specific recombinase XerD